MSFNNNSRNVANLLRFEPLQPIRPNNQQRINTIQPPSRQRQEIPVLDVFTPQDNISEKRNSRRIAPLSSGGNNRNQDLSRGARNPTNDMEFQALKIRLDQIIKYYDERNSNLETKLMVRLNELQNFVMKQVPKIDNTIMISSDIAGFKEALKEVRRQQEIQFNQINSLKAITRERNNADSLAVQNAKDKQKMTVLFMELVRLGDTIQKMNDQVGSSARAYENRIQDLQQKLANSEKNLSIISQRTSSGTQVLNQFGDKLMNRLQSAESNLLILGKQQIKQRQVMNSITSQNQRIGQDINTMILNMQTDFQNKLENRMNEQLNRLMNEHEERIRAQQEIRKNLDIMERIHQQKQQSDKLQNKARLNDMDVAVRNEFLKKEQSIKGLQMGMQQQFRSLMNELQIQAGKRKEQEAAFRFEIKKVQQSLRKQYDLYKNHQSELMDTITGLIKTEVQSRTIEDQDLKKITMQVGKMIADDLNNLKQSISISNKKLNMAIKEVANESSERSGQLSHYIDKEIKNVVDVVTQKYSKMKNVFTKIADQFKTHLQTSEANRKSHDSRIIALQEDFEKLKSEMNQEMDDFYNDMEAKIKQQKQFVETVVFKKTNQLTLKVNKLQQYTNQYFEVLKSGIQDNKELLNNKMRDDKNNKNQQSEEQVKQLRSIIFEMKRLTQENKAQNTQNYHKLDKEIQQLESKTKQTIVDLTNSLNTKIIKNSQKITQNQQKINDMTVKVNSIRAQSGSETAISSDRLKKISDDITDVKNKLAQNQQTNQKAINHTDQEIIKIKSDITVLKGEVGALDDDIKKLSVSAAK